MGGFTLGGDMREVGLKNNDDFSPDLYESKQHLFEMSRPLGRKLLNLAYQI